MFVGGCAFPVLVGEAQRQVRTRFHASEISNIGLPDSYLVLGVPYLDHGLPSLQSDLASFHSWSLDPAGGKALQPADLVDSSRVLYPRWQFDVYFNAMGGHGIGGGTRDTGEGLWHSPFIGGIPYLESENQGLPIAGKDGYELGGWYSDPVYSGLKAESDIVPLKLYDTLYASWAGLVWVDFETGGIGAPERSRQYYPSVRYREDAYDEYNNGLPVRGADEGCYFMHWVDSGGNEVDGMDYVPACRHTLSALYACPVRVRFDARGGNEVAEGTYYTHVAWQGRYGMCQNPGLPTVSRDGFQFGGWFRDQACSEAVDEGDPVREEDSVLFAKWEGAVTVAFEVGGGEPVEARMYYTGFAYRDASVGNPGLPDAVKDGAVFEGWYSGPGFEEKVSETSLVTAGLTVLHARFGEKVSVSFECNGGEKLPDCEYYSCFAYRDGKVRAVGVSNFQKGRFYDFAYHADVKPMVNQLQCNATIQQDGIQAVLGEFGTKMMAWGPLGGQGSDAIFSNETLKQIGLKYGKTASQVALRWLTRRGIVAIPKSTHKERMAENLDIFDFSLTDGDMAAIAKLNRHDEGTVDFGDPAFVKMLLDTYK